MNDNARVEEIRDEHRRSGYGVFTPDTWAYKAGELLDAYDAEYDAGTRVRERLESERVYYAGVKDRLQQAREIIQVEHKDRWAGQCKCPWCEGKL